MLLSLCVDDVDKHRTIALLSMMQITADNRKIALCTAAQMKADAAAAAAAAATVAVVHTNESR